MLMPFTVALNMKHLYFLTFSLSILTCLMARILILPDGRKFEIPEPHTYPYILEEESPASLNRLYILTRHEPHATILCPKGYSIQEMRQELVLNETLQHLIPKSILKEQTISLRDSKSDDDHNSAPCPTAYHCLGYQACLFTYSKDLCQREFLPPQSSEFFVLNVGCFRDDLFEMPKKFRRNKDFVLYVQYSPNEISFLNLTHVESSEETVFNGKCPSIEDAKKEGYFGKCLEYPPSPSIVSLQLWTALGKLEFKDCRTKIIETLCALHYNSQGFCIPPVHRNENLKDHNLQMLPEHKNNLNLEEYRKFLNRKISDLIPARLAFVIMTKRNVKRTISMLQLIYRENFLYVIHVDKEETQLREELGNQIQESFAIRHNIIFLPFEKSFSTTHDSYDTVRAKMEAYENLLRFGIWDFVVTLSEDDMPLRNVDDLSMALAPHRGLSFLPDLFTVKSKKSEPVISCRGLVHEFSSLSITFQAKSNISLYSSSSDGILSREFVEHLVDGSQRSKEFNELQFYLQTLKYSYRNYIPTILMNSPFKNSVHISNICIAKKNLQRFIPMEPILAENNTISFEEANIMEEDNFVEKDEPLLKKLSHHFFFARKLSNRLEDNAQKFAIQLANGEYYQHLESVLPTPVLKSFLEETIKNISVELKMQPRDILMESLLKLQIVPSLVPNQMFCRSEIIPKHSEFNIEYSYWLDVSAYFKKDKRQRTIRIMLQPSVTSRKCFKNEHLRMVALSPWYSEPNRDSSYEWSNFQENMPVPYFMSNIKGVIINFLVVDEVENIFEADNTTRLKGKSGPIELKISARSHKKATTCFESTEIILSEESGAYRINNDENNEYILVKPHSLTLTCHNMETGFWTVDIKQTYPRILKEYSLQFYVLDVENQENMGSLSEDIGSLWTLKHFAFVTKNDTYDFYSDELKQSSNFGHIRDSKKAETSKAKVFEVDKMGFKPKSDKAYLFICGGGLISSFAVFLTVIVLFCGWRYRFHPKIVLCFVAMLCLITVFQIIIIVSVCK